MEDFPEPDDSKPVTFLADCPPRLWTQRSGRLGRFSERIIAKPLIDIRISNFSLCTPNFGTWPYALATPTNQPGGLT